MSLLLRGSAPPVTPLAFVPPTLPDVLLLPARPGTQVEVFEVPRLGRWVAPELVDVPPRPVPATRLEVFETPSLGRWVAPVLPEIPLAGRAQSRIDTFETPPLGRWVPPDLPEVPLSGKPASQVHVHEVPPLGRWQQPELIDVPPRPVLQTGIEEFRVPEMGGGAVPYATPELPDVPLRPARPPAEIYTHEVPPLGRWVPPDLPEIPLSAKPTSQVHTFETPALGRWVPQELPDVPPRPRLTAPSDLQVFEPLEPGVENLDWLPRLPEMWLRAQPLSETHTFETPSIGHWEPPLLPEVPLSGKPASQVHAFETPPLGRWVPQGLLDVPPRPRLTAPADLQVFEPLEPGVENLDWLPHLPERLVLALRGGIDAFEIHGLGHWEPPLLSEVPPRPRPTIVSDLETFEPFEGVLESLDWLPSLPEMWLRERPESQVEIFETLRAPGQYEPPALPDSSPAAPPVARVDVFEVPAGTGGAVGNWIPQVYGQPSVAVFGRGVWAFEVPRRSAAPPSPGAAPPRPRFGHRLVRKIFMFDTNPPDEPKKKKKKKKVGRLDAAAKKATKR